jgi:hypothetical protein
MVSSQNYVIEHPDGEHLAAFFEAPRNVLVLYAWPRITRRMIMDKDHCGGRQM